MSLPITFASLPTGNVPASNLDSNFAAVGALTIIPCTASGTNAITLTPVTNAPSVSGYTAFQQFSFVAAATSTGAVTININSIGAIPLNVIGGTQAGAGQIVSGLFYVIALNATGTAAVIVSAQISGSVVQRGYLSGMTLSNDGTSPNTVLDVSAGLAVDSANIVNINLAAWTKSTAGSWVAGSGANGMGTGLTIAINTWYHVFAIINTGAADVYFDTDPGAANKPASTTAFRRIGSFRTATASTSILAFSQFGDEFLWSTTFAENGGASFTVGTAASLLTLTGIPTGVKVNALFHGVANNGAGIASVLFTSPDESDQAVSSFLRSITTPGTGLSASGDYNRRSNTSAQIRARADTATTNVFVGTYGYIDPRGRLA